MQKTNDPSSIEHLMEDPEVAEFMTQALQLGEEVAKPVVLEKCEGPGPHVEGTCTPKTKKELRHERREKKKAEKAKKKEERVKLKNRWKQEPGVVRELKCHDFTDFSRQDVYHTNWILEFYAPW